MSDLKLGQIIDTPQFRDAIHVAVAPVSSNETLYPGQHVGVITGTSEVSSIANALHGIVDPYLKHAVTPGQKFWLFLYPQTVTGLRHDWTHPAFVDAAPAQVPTPGKIASKSETWLREFASGKGLDLRELIEAAGNYLDSGSYLCDGSRFKGEYVPDDFWNHYSDYVGVKVDENKRGSFFSCSC